MENEACLLYAVQGRTTIYGAEYTNKVGPEDGILMKCGNFVSNWEPSHETDPNEAITIHFFPDVLQLIFENNIPGYLQNPINTKNRVFQRIEKNAILKSYIDSLLVYFDHPELFNEETIKLKLRELIALLHRLDSNGVSEILSDLFNPGELQFKKVVAEHIFHDLSLQDFATLLNLSVSTFRRRFYEIYDYPPGRYILGKKLERASQLLHSGLRVSEVCYDCGFGDPSNFSKAFTKKYGITPSAFKSQSSGNGIN